MKKVYIKPEITIVTVKYQMALLIGSNPAVRNVFPGDDAFTMDPDGELDDEEDDV